MLIMRTMKKYILPILAVAVLAGCESIYVPTLKEVPVRPTNVKKPKADSQVSATGYHWLLRIGQMFPRFMMKHVA